MLRGLYDWTMWLAAHPQATFWLGLIAFVESSVFPIPPDVMLVPMVIAAPARAWLIAAVATLGSVLGGILGYALGYFFYESIGVDIIAFYGYADKFGTFQGWYHEYGAWIVAAGGFTPLPYKVITIASGVAALDPLTFVLASIASRGARFLIEAALLWKFGPPIRRFVEERLAILSVLFFILLVGGFVALKFIL